MLKDLRICAAGELFPTKWRSRSAKRRHSSPLGEHRTLLFGHTFPSRHRSPVCLRVCRSLREPSNPIAALPRTTSAAAPRSFHSFSSVFSQRRLAFLIHVSVLLSSQLPVWETPADREQLKASPRASTWRVKAQRSISGRAHAEESTLVSRSDARAVLSRSLHCGLQPGGFQPCVFH